MRTPAVLLLLIPAGILAQEIPAQPIPTVLPEVLVTEKPFSLLGGTTPTLAESEEAWGRLAAAATVKNMSRAQEGADVTLADSLAMIPGVYARSRNQSPQTRLSIRGSGLARNADVRGIALQLNGLPLNAADSDFDYLTAIEPLSLSQIIVIRSANASGATVNNLGGSIDFISNTGRNSGPGMVRAEFGSYGYFRQNASGAWQTEQSDGYGSINNLMLDGYRDHSQQNRQHFDVNLAWSEKGHWENRLYFTRVQSEEELPGALTQAQIFSNPRQAATSPNPLFNRALADWKDEIEWNRVADQFFLQGSDQKVRGGFWFSYAEIRNPRNQIYDVNYHDTGGRITWEREMFLGERENTFSAAWTPTYAWSSDPVYQNLLGGNRGAMVEDSSRQWFNSDLYLQNRLQLRPDLSWIMSLQFSYALRSLQGHLNPAGGVATRDRTDYYAVSPATGLVYEPIENIQFYGNAARSAEPPTMGDLYAPGLPDFLPQKIQTAVTLEVGTRGRKGALRWEAVFYQSWLENEFLVSETFPGSGITVTRNTPNSTHRGVEAGLGWEFLPQPDHADSVPVEGDSLLLNGTLTWNDFFLENDPLYGDNRLAGVPEIVSQLTLRYRHGSGFYAEPNVLIQPEGMYADYANTLRSDTFTIFGFRLGYERPTGPQIFLEVQNLSDETYITDVSVIGNAHGLDQRVFWPGSGRAFYVGLAWKW